MSGKQKRNLENPRFVSRTEPPFPPVRDSPECTRPEKDKKVVCTEAALLLLLLLLLPSALLCSSPVVRYVAHAHPHLFWCVQIRTDIRVWAYRGSFICTSLMALVVRFALTELRVNEALFFALGSLPTSDIHGNTSEVVWKHR